MKRSQSFFLIICVMVFSTGCNKDKSNAGPNQLWKVVVPDTLTNTQINAICEYNINSVWVGTNHGIWVFKDTLLTTTITTKDGLLDNDIRDIKKNSKNEMIIFTGTGINRYDGTMHVINTDNIDYRSYRYFAVDPYDNIWMLTNQAYSVRQGLLKLNNGKVTYYDPAGAAGYKGYDSENYTYIYADSKGRIWIGYYYTPIVLFVVENGKVDYFDTNLVTDVYSITGDSKNNIWISSDYSLVKYDGTNFTSYSYGSTYGLFGIDILTDHNDDIWEATVTEIKKLHSGIWQSEYAWSETNPWQDPNSDYIDNAKMMEDSRHYIWVCTDKGIMRKENF